MNRNVTTLNIDELSCVAGGSFELEMATPTKESESTSSSTPASGQPISTVGVRG